ncbi:hypothetical protein CDD83_3121 [Cordyceps sp. RAO-2017]|nr:hypothetical protein CDD83_3121 [Cordyceps sp. RAO-2017]
MKAFTIILAYLAGNGLATSIGLADKPGSHISTSYNAGRRRDPALELYKQCFDEIDEDEELLSFCDPTRRTYENNMEKCHEAHLKKNFKCMATRQSQSDREHAEWCLNHAVEAAKASMEELKALGTETDRQEFEHVKKGWKALEACVAEQ